MTGAVFMRSTRSAFQLLTQHFKLQPLLLRLVARELQFTQLRGGRLETRGITAEQLGIVHHRLYFRDLRLKLGDPSGQGLKRVFLLEREAALAGLTAG